MGKKLELNIQINNKPDDRLNFIADIFIQIAELVGGIVSGGITEEETNEQEKLE